MELLSTKQVATLLGIHISTVYALIKRGDLTATKLGPKLIKIHKSELDKYTKGQS